jgi:hypothetical protein
MPDAKNLGIGTVRAFAMIETKRMIESYSVTGMLVDRPKCFFLPTQVSFSLNGSPGFSATAGKITPAETLFSFENDSLRIPTRS